MPRPSPSPEWREARRRIVALVMFVLIVAAIVVTLFLGSRFGASGA